MTVFTRRTFRKHLEADKTRKPKCLKEGALDAAGDVVGWHRRGGRDEDVRVGDAGH